MPNEVLNKPGAAVIWQASGGDAAITLASLASGTARSGVKFDLDDGVTANRWARRWHVLFTIETGSVAPAAGSTMELFWAASTSTTAGTENPGFYLGTDAAYPVTIDVDEALRQLLFVGALVMTNNATTKQIQGFVFQPPTQFGGFVVMNRTGQTIETNDDEHEIRMTPIIDEIQ